MNDTVLVNKREGKENTVVKANDFTAGNGSFGLIAGPCAVEKYEVTLEIAKKVREAGATLFRAGAFKPRTSPYTFQGMGEEGLRILAEVGKEAGIAVISEITDPRQLPLFENIDVIQVGTRNSRNYELLKELGKCGKPVLLKRGMCDTVEEFLESAEYIALSGNENIILCERGIRTFENSMRNTLDIGGIIMLKEKTHLPVIADPSHAAGLAYPIEKLSLAATAAGADGLMIEVHTSPDKSLSDPDQAITPGQFSIIADKVKKLRNSGII